MNKNVVLFLTTPSSTNRIEMCLKNFKQLEKLGFDIITLTTTDLLPKYIYEKSKYLISDYTSHTCDKKFYYDFYNKTNGCGYYMYDVNESHRVILFSDTHFPSLLRNFRSLITYAKSLGYENYFYVEDDHFFHDNDLHLIHDFIEKLNEYDMVFFSFKTNRHHEETAFCSYFHFGKVNTMFDISKNFAYSEYEYKNFDDNIYANFYETVFSKLVVKYKTEKDTILNVFDSLSTIFKNSSLNLVYSYKNIIDDARCNLLYDDINNVYLFYYSTVGFIEPIDFKITFDNNLYQHKVLPPGCWSYTFINSDLINKTDVIFNDKLIKSYRNVTLNNIIYNGKIFFNSGY